MESYGTKLGMTNGHEKITELCPSSTLCLQVASLGSSRSWAARYGGLLHIGMSQQVAITMIMQQRHFEVSHAGVRLLHIHGTRGKVCNADGVVIRILHDFLRLHKCYDCRSKDKEYYDLHQTSKALFQHAESVRRYITIDVQIFTSYKYAQIECSSFDKFN
ncbi:hypothetical protein KCU84_g24, partial [Aureobasidium melanogenum]